MKSHHSRSFFRWPAAAVVLSLHLAALAWIAMPSVDFTRDSEISQEVPVSTEFVVVDEAARNAVPVPELTLKPVNMRTTAVSRVRFESEDWGDISGVTGPASAPMLSRYQPVNAAAFARRAGLRAGQAASVVITVEVLADGRVGYLEMTRTSGNPAADAAALQYARRLRWIPGTRDRHAEVMRISLPVTLVWSA